MRIISGNLKGRKIPFLKELSIRPTTDRAKEAIFNILDNRYYFKNKCMLDLCSGTGNIAFEFASRGIKNITAVDNNIKCINQIKSNAKILELEILTILSDCKIYIEKCTQKFDFIYLDPPYNYTKYKELKELILKKQIIKENGCLIIEHDKNTCFNEKNLELRKYGNVQFSIFSF